MTTQYLELLADVLEKSAQYQETLERDNIRLSSSLGNQKEAQVQEDTEQLLQMVSAHAGTVVNDDLRAKVAATPESVRNVLRDLVNKQASTDLGQAVPSQKNRSLSYADDPDAAFAAWITS